MKLEDVKKVVGDLPWMTIGQARFVEMHCRTHKLSRLLEFGHMHGVSTCYLAAIAQANGGGVTTVDLPQAAERSPNLEKLLAQLRLDHLVEILRPPEGGAWAAMQMLEAGRRFDFAYLDAGHSFECTGLFFFLASMLVKSGGWILFDDLNYTVENAGQSKEPWAARMTERQKSTKQVGKVWDLIVKTHPQFDSFLEVGANWGLCRKK